MTYIENIFLCMVSPLLVAALCMGRRQLRFFLFCIAGMGVCLLSAYINTFLAAVCQADALAATAEIAPVVEEMMKLLPLVFYLLVFEPEGDKIKAAAITVALAFATFENVCYLIQNGADRFSFIFFRNLNTIFRKINLRISTCTYRVQCDRKYIVHTLTDLKDDRTRVARITCGFNTQDKLSILRNL